MLDPVMNPWDAGPFPAILAEAGGTFGDWRGRPGIHHGEGMAVNAALRAPLLDLLAGDGAQATER
jgi:fructose-1,6-bisphosphatase/inositol monophosphatase family enzyme